MKRTRRLKLTRRELASVTSKRPVLRRIRPSSATNSLTKSSVSNEREERRSA